jgi:2-hydroxy-3-keto-5-methylthiopentenyl-1-phosphate phosphatase
MAIHRGPERPSDPPSVRPRVRVLIDFDGTLVEGNVAQILLEAFAPNGRHVSYRIEQELSAGRMSLREAWRRQVALLPADRLREMAEFAVRHCVLRSGALELLETLHSYGVWTVVVSGGLDFYIRPILVNAGIDLPMLSDTIVLPPGQRLEVKHPHGHATCHWCGLCKAQIALSVAPKSERTIFIGGGSTDRFAAEVADIVFARHRLQTYCETAGLSYFAFDSGFAPMTQRMRGWLTGQESWPPARARGRVGSRCPISRSLVEGHDARSVPLAAAPRTGWRPPADMIVPTAPS